MIALGYVGITPLMHAGAHEMFWRCQRGAAILPAWERTLITVFEVGHIARMPSKGQYRWWESLDLKQHVLVTRVK